ncbi:MAG: class I SAM-dependent methyltransferase [Desulfocapsaceae bacterium]|jgi:16S rRNA (guanine1516-N2)-methyltransferase|nr:class I SAM-dependent methyltransferase [Desulfocapsaceae bacterium]
MDIKQFVQIWVKSTSGSDWSSAVALGTEIGLDIVSVVPTTTRFYLFFNNGRLELRENVSGKSAHSGIYVDFLSGSTWFRYKHDRRINQPLARAVGIKKGVRPLICDATAGYGVDGFILASLGCNVTMIERSPVIWALLADGLKRASEHEELSSIIGQNILLKRGSSDTFLQQADTTFETIYLDPMYPPTKKSALNKRKMRVLRNLVGEDQDHAELLERSLKSASARVVVKRPAGAPAIKGPDVSYRLTGKNSRYDIYLTDHL